MSTWGRSNPDDEHEEPQLRVERVAGQLPPWKLLAGLIAVVLLIGTLWLKPWDEDRPAVAIAPRAVERATVPTDRPPTEAPEHTAAATTPSPTLNPVIVAARRRQCQSPQDWRMVTAETTVTRETRTMYAASPVRALGPGDPGLSLSRLYAGNLRAVGVCVPRSPVVSPTTTLLQVVLWQVDGHGTVREVLRPVVLDSTLYDAGEAYFAPPAGGGTYWPEGRYVFEIRRAEGAGSRWIGLEFVHTGAEAIGLLR